MLLLIILIRVVVKYCLDAIRVLVKYYRDAIRWLRYNRDLNTYDVYNRKQNNKQPHNAAFMCRTEYKRILGTATSVFIHGFSTVYPRETSVFVYTQNNNIYSVVISMAHFGSIFLLR